MEKAQQQQQGQQRDQGQNPTDLEKSSMATSIKVKPVNTASPSTLEAGQTYTGQQIINHYILKNPETSNMKRYSSEQFNAISEAAKKLGVDYSSLNNNRDTEYKIPAGETKPQDTKPEPPKRKPEDEIAKKSSYLNTPKNLNGEHYTYQQIYNYYAFKDPETSNLRTNSSAQYSAIMKKAKADLGVDLNDLSKKRDEIFTIQKDKKKKVVPVVKPQETKENNKLEKTSNLRSPRELKAGGNYTAQQIINYLEYHDQSMKAAPNSQKWNIRNQVILKATNGRVSLSALEGNRSAIITLNKAPEKIIVRASPSTTDTRTQTRKEGNTPEEKVRSRLLARPGVYTTEKETSRPELTGTVKVEQNREINFGPDKKTTIVSENGKAVAVHQSKVPGFGKLRYFNKEGQVQERKTFLGLTLGKVPSEVKEAVGFMKDARKRRKGKIDLDAPVELKK